MPYGFWMMPNRPTTSALPCRSALVSRIPKPGRLRESARGGPESALALYPAYGLPLAPAGHGDRDITVSVLCTHKKS